MKYVVIDPDSEAVLASVTAESTTAEWAIERKDSKGQSIKSILRGQIEISGGVLSAKIAEPEGMRIVLPVHRQGSTGVMTFATPVGNLRVRASKAVASEGQMTGQSGAKALKSPIPGKILKLLCKVGDLVEAGQSVLVIEAMKMENEIRSPQAGRIEELAVQTGQSVSTGDLLVKIGKREGLS